MNEDPRLDDLRSWYIEGRRANNPFASDVNLVARFDRTHAELIQEAKAEALREAADAFSKELGPNAANPAPKYIVGWLHNRAAKLEGER